MNIFDWGMNQTFNIYYDECCKTLDISPYHTSSALKKAYHKKVFESHPDKGGTTKDFIKVNEAYKFLSSLLMDNPQPSKCRDFIPLEKMQNNNLKMNNIPKKDRINLDYNEKENEKPFNNKNKIKKSPKNINYKLDIELSDAYYGARKIIKLNRNRICKTCKEKNLLNDANINCEECGGRKYSSQIKEVQLIIKPGTYTGCKVTFKGEGEEYLEIEPGDIIFDIHVKENKNFLRKGSDLYIHKCLTISEFLGMDNILINLFGKTKFYVNKNKIIKVEQKKIIKNVFEGNYIQYIKNMNTTAEKKLINNIALNKNNCKKNITDNKTNINNYKPIKKTKFIPKFNLKKEINNQNEKNKIKKSNNNFRSQSELNKSFNKKSQINNTNQNEKEKEKEIKKLEIYELVKFDETLVNKSYFYQKSN